MRVSNAIETKVAMDRWFQRGILNAVDKLGSEQNFVESTGESIILKWYELKHVIVRCVN